VVGQALSNRSTCRRVGQACPISSWDRSDRTSWDRSDKSVRPVGSCFGRTVPVRPPVEHRCLSTARTAVFNRLMPAVLSSAPLQAANIQATTQACPLPGWDQLNADAEAEWQAGKENAKKAPTSPIQKTSCPRCCNPFLDVGVSHFCTRPSFYYCSTRPGVYYRSTWLAIYYHSTTPGIYYFRTRPGVYYCSTRRQHIRLNETNTLGNSQ
jgi:hypothetical protein